MSNINLNALLDSLESDYGMEKSASASTSVAAPGQVNVSDELKTVLEKRASLDVSKSAFEDGEKVARELLEKLAGDVNLAIAENAVSVASDDAKVTPTVDGSAEGVLQGTVAKQVALGATGEDRVDPILDKQASEKEENFNMANRILEKLAEAVGAPDVGQVSGISAPNLAQANTLAQVAFDDSKIEGTPGTEGNVNAVLQNIVAKFQAKGAGSENLADGQIAAEGAQVTQGIQGGNEEIEKAAAVAYLTDAGVDFNSAVDMVKEAEFNMEKEAAFEALTEAGFDFDTAVEMVKEAADNFEGPEIGRGRRAYRTAKEGVNELGRKISSSGAYKAVAGEAKNLSHEAGVLASRQVMPKGSRLGALKNLGGNRIVQGLAAAGALGAGAAAYNHYEKKAALDELVEAGYDFDTAVDLVKEASILSEGAQGPDIGKARRAYRESGAEKVVGAVSREGRKLIDDAKGVRAFGVGKGSMGRDALKGLGKNRIVQGLAAAGALGAGAAAYNHYEKKAAMDELLEAGMDFDTAVDLIKQAEYELGEE